jgi:hypothetical protein
MVNNICTISYMSEVTKPHRPSYGSPTRGVTGRDVELAADALLRDGERPTIERVRERIGRGSPNTINPLLDAWWQRLAARLDAGPPALHRLPETVAHVAEALWMQALDEARRRAEQELSRQARNTAKLEVDLEVRSHVLTLREGELKSRLDMRERDVDELRLQLRTLELRGRKDQATISAQAERIASLEKQLFGAAGRAQLEMPKKTSRRKARSRAKAAASRRRAGKLRDPQKVSRPTKSRSVRR